MQEVSRIVAIGPESTGKSTLCQLLAQEYDALWCPEYAREYLVKHGTQYTFHDLLVIAKGQLALEAAYTLKAVEDWNLKGRKTPKPLLFVDTNMYVMKVWCEYVFGKCHQFILDEIVKSEPDLYLLCDVDLPWVTEELREYPDLQSREELYHIYKDILINQNVPWYNIKGHHNSRLKIAVKAVNDVII